MLAGLPLSSSSTAAAAVSSRLQPPPMHLLGQRERMHWYEELSLPEDNNAGSVRRYASGAYSSGWGSSGNGSAGGDKCFV